MKISELSKGTYEAIATYMDDDLREELHSKLAPCTDEEFLAEYIKRAWLEDTDFIKILKNEFNLEVDTITKFFYMDYVSNGDFFSEMFDTAEEALDYGEKMWNHLHSYDKERRQEVLVGEYEIDEDGCPDVMTGAVRIVRQFK